MGRKKISHNKFRRSVGRKCYLLTVEVGLNECLPWRILIPLKSKVVNINMVSEVLV